MATIVFLSAVSDEFHTPDPEPDPRLRRHFDSYREVLATELRRVGPDYIVISQEVLALGFGDLLQTLDDDVRRSDVVVHLVGNLSGAVPKPAEVRRLRERHPDFLAHQPELRQALGDLSEISYTQWEMYLAYQHERKQLLFVALPEAPRSPVCSAEAMTDSQKSHLARLEEIGKHRLTFEHQLRVVNHVFVSLLKFGLGPGIEAARNEAAVDRARLDVRALTHKIADDIRKPDPAISAAHDPAGIVAYLAAIDTATLQCEINRREVLELVEEYRDGLRETVAADPTYEDLRELALAELAAGNYPEAIETARRAATLAEEKITADPDSAEAHRRDALNAYLLLREAASAARLRDEAIAALKQGCALIDRDHDPILWAEYHEELAQFYLDHAMIQPAEELIDEIIDIREEHEPKSVALAGSLLVWCRLLMAKANYEGVLGVARRAEQIYVDQGDPRQVSVASAVGFRATALRALGRLQETEPLFRRVLAVYEAAYGPEHPDVATGLNNLAGLLEATGRHAEAEPMYRRALAIREAAYGPEHPDVATGLNNLAELLRATGRHAEAEPMYRRALAIREAAYGPEHPGVATDLNNLAGLLYSTGRHAEAEPMYRRALAIREAAYGPEHPGVATNLNNLAGLLRATGRHAEAEPMYRRALAIDEAAYGPEHPDVATGLNNLAGLLYSTGRHAEAEPMYRRALAIREAAYGPEHPGVATDLNNLAGLLYSTGRHAEAEPMYRRALAIDEAAYGPEHPDVATGLNNLAGLLEATGRHAEAEPMYRRALAIREAAYGPEHPGVATGLNNLAGLLEATGRHAEAEPMYRRALAIREAAYGPEHPGVATDLNNLAGLLYSTGRHAEAEPMYRRALAIDEAAYGPEHPDVATGLNNLAGLLEATGRHAEAEPMYRRALAILVKFQFTNGHQHPNLEVVQGNYVAYLETLGQTPEQIEVQIREIVEQAARDCNEEAD